MGESCYSGCFDAVAEGDRARESSAVKSGAASRIPLTIRMSQLISAMAFLLLNHLSRNATKGGDMTQARWLLLGAILLGLAIGLYIVFCPTECH